MKSFKEVLAASKHQLLEAHTYQIQNEKEQVLRRIKSDMMITGKLRDLTESRQHDVLSMLLEYWSPKNGINRAGERYLNEGVMSVDEKSTPTAIKAYAARQIHNNISGFQSAFATGQGKNAVGKLTEDIARRTGKNIDGKSLHEMVCSALDKKMRLDNE